MLEIIERLCVYMSDEERLERIIRESKGVVWNTETDEDLLTELDTPDFNWLIEQAERVKELEKELERVKVKYRATKETQYRYSELISELEQQNKRYHEFLEDMYNHAYGLQLYPHVVDEIKKLLEETEDA